MTWQPVEPLSRTPWTADFAAAKGRAIIFGVLAVIIIVFAAPLMARDAYIRRNFVEVQGYGDHIRSMFPMIEIEVSGQLYVVPYESCHRPRFTDIMRCGRVWPTSSSVMLVDVNNPQNTMTKTIMPIESGMVFVIGTTFGVASLFCMVIAKAGRRDIPGDHRSPLR
ncbi:MAG: hypothetical protein FWC93_03195 [Defluviitaleaceae bacterium]|nr:hypothetical protein [Defluviitaleaceae bacterium]